MVQAFVSKGHKYRNQIKEETSIQATPHNPFIFDNHKLWEKAIEYLEHYIQQRVERILEGKELLIYTDREPIPFMCAEEVNEICLEEILRKLEVYFGKVISPKDRAYISCKFYNDIQQAILEEALHRGVFEEIEYRLFGQILFMKKLKRLLKQGQILDIETIKEMYYAYSYRGLYEYLT